MELSEAIRRRIPLLIDHPIGGARPIAELFEIDGGIAFADCGWARTSNNPFHAVMGRVEVREDDWLVGDGSIRVCTEADGGAWDDQQAWRAWRDTAEGKPYDRDRCWTEIQRSGALEPAPA